MKQMNKLKKTIKTFSIIVIFTLSFLYAGLIFSGVCFQTKTQTNDTDIIKPIKKTPKVTVLMSTFNRATYLPEAIESILNQTFKNFEFIIVNDGSTDNTDKILTAYAKKDSRIKIINNNRNKGLIDSLNHGLDLSTGQYIARMDDDDLSLPYRLELQTKYLDAHPEITVLGGAYITREDNIRRMGGPATPEMAKIISYIRVPVMHPTTMIRRDFLKEHSIRYNAKYPSSEDNDFFHQIAIKGGKILNLKNPLLIYALHSPKAREYHSVQADSHNRFVLDTLAPYMDTKKITPTAEGICYILNQMEQAAVRNQLDIDLPSVRQLILYRNCQSRIIEN